jgi:hypothetical protein
VRPKALVHKALAAVHMIGRERGIARGERPHLPRSVGQYGRPSPLGWPSPQCRRR